MEILALIGGLLYLAVLGFWLMGKLDRFFKNSGFSPDPDAEPEAAPAASVRHLSPAKRAFRKTHGLSGRLPVI